MNVQKHDPFKKKMKDHSVSKLTQNKKKKKRREKDKKIFSPIHFEFECLKVKCCNETIGNLGFKMYHQSESFFFLFVFCFKASH